MSSSPDRKAGSPAASPDREVDAKSAIPVAGDDNDGEQPADATAETDGITNDIDDDLHGGNVDEDDNISDDESILSEVDEAQFDNFDPENVDVEDRPQLAIDEDNLKLIGRHKRKRTEDGETRPRRKEGRREKKSRRAVDEGDEEKGSSRRRERKQREEKPDTDEETLDPETRMFCSLLTGLSLNKDCTDSCSTGRRRALDRAMDEAMKKPTKRRFRKQDGIVSVAPSGLYPHQYTNCTFRIWNLWQMLRLRTCVSA